MKTCALVLATVVSVNAFGQTLRVETSGANATGPPAATDAFGTASQSVLTVSPWEFVIFAAAAAIGYDGLRRYNQSGQTIAAVHLPTGALVTGMELEACDSNASAQVAVAFFECADVISCSTPNLVGTGNAQTPGCGRFPVVFPTAVAIKNDSFRYFLLLTTGNATTTEYASVRVRYKLQVSPAPVSATFTDVPTSHPFFQYIEALAAAGVTGGCVASPLQYCPDAPVTRGQMAVFLSRALGLHFPN